MKNNITTRQDAERIFDGISNANFEVTKIMMKNITKDISANIENWEDRWAELLRYLRALDKINNTDYTKVFPLLNVK